MLIGRQRESERVRRLVDDVRAGRSGALLVHGDPGIGKTALLEDARDRAAGMLVLEVRGVEAESDLPFAGLWDLVAPLLHLRDGLPPAQAAALGQALALEGGGTPPRFAVPIALLGLLGAAADESPVLCVVDDLQWIDEPSREAIVFAARRLGSNGVGMLLAVRDEVGRKVAVAGVERLHVGALRTDAAAELLLREHGDRLTATVASELVHAASGNPLALVELPRVLTDDQLAGREALPPVLPAGLSVEGAYRHYLAGLPEPTRRALVVAAAAGGGEDLGTIQHAMGALGLEAQALDLAEASDVVSQDGVRLRFRHPLLRAAAYHLGSPPERREAHRALADAAPDGTPARAWHLAASVVTADEDVARDLELAASQARLRGGHASAAQAYARAADLTPDAGQRARRMLEAATDRVAAGSLEQAGADAEASLLLADDIFVRAGLERIRAHVRMRSGRPGEGAREMAAAAADIEEEMPPLASAMLLESALGYLLTGPAEEAIRLAEDARKLAGGIDVLEAIADVLIGQALTAGGELTAAEGRIAAHEAFLFEADPPAGASEAVAAGAHASMWGERFDRAQRILDRLVERARSEGALARLAYPLTVRAQLLFWRGSWMDALADAEEGVRASADSGQKSVLSYSLQSLAEIEAHVGRGQASREHAEEALRVARETESPVFGPYARAVLGVLGLLGGDSEGGIHELDRARAELRAVGMPAPGSAFWTVELVEAHVRAGDAQAAAAELELVEQLIRDDHPAYLRAQRARCRALAAEGEASDAQFEDALALHAGSPTPFQRARTELAYGERLRRRNVRADSRKHLRAALETFERLGATPWIDRTRSELRASGVLSARESTPVADLLSPHELQVALIVARGATNKEAAATLFVSPKTVEHHLGQIYRKLDIRSRTQLSALLGAQQAGSAA